MMLGDDGCIFIDFKALASVAQIRLIKDIMFEQADVDMSLVKACVAHLALQRDNVFQELFHCYLKFQDKKSNVLSGNLFQYLFSGFKDEITAAKEQLSSEQFEVLYDRLQYEIKMNEVRFVDETIDWLAEQQLLDRFREHLFTAHHNHNFLISFEVSHDNRDKIRLLLDHGMATVTQKTFGRGNKFCRFEPLELAVECQNIDVFVMLLDYFNKTYPARNLLGDQHISQLSCAPMSLKVNYLQKAIESDAYDIAKYLIQEKKVNLNYVTAYYQGQWHASAYMYKEDKLIPKSYLMAMKCLLQIAAMHNREAIFKLILKDPATMLLHYFTGELLTTDSDYYDRMIELEAAERLVKYYQEEVASRPDNDYKNSITIFDHTFNFGYSAGEKKVAVAALRRVIENAEAHVNLEPLSKHRGAVINGRLGEAFNLFCKAKGIRPKDIPKAPRVSVV